MCSQMQNRKCYISQLWGMEGNQDLPITAAAVRQALSSWEASWKAKRNSWLLDSSADMTSFGPIRRCIARLPRCLHLNSFSCLLCLLLTYDSFCSQQRSFDLPFCSLSSLFTSISQFLPFTNTLILQVIQLCEMSQRLTCLQALGR